MRRELGVMKCRKQVQTDEASYWGVKVEREVIFGMERWAW